MLLVLGVDVLTAFESLESFDVRFPYLFFKYRAHELNAAPSLSSFVDVFVDERNGEGSRDFNACDERLRDRSPKLLLLPATFDNVEDAPYRLEYKFKEIRGKQYFIHFQ